MKKLIFTMVALLTMTVAMAQNSDNKKSFKMPTPAEQTERMTKKLGLSADQAAKVKALNEAYQDLFKGKGRGPRPQMNKDNKEERPQLTDEMKQKMKAEHQAHKAKRQEYETKLKAILTAEQYTAYQNMHPKRKDKNKE